MTIRYSLSHPRLPANVFRFYNTQASLERFLRYDTDPSTNRPIPIYDTALLVDCYYELDQSGQEFRRSDGTVVQEGYNFMFKGKVLLNTRDRVSVNNIAFNIIMSNFDPTNRFTFAIMEKVAPFGDEI